jgi:hypothetical protein
MRHRQARKHGPTQQNFFQKGMEEIRACRI